MILVAIGSNLPHPVFGKPEAVCHAALAAMPVQGIRVIRHSRWYSSTPVPSSNQPLYINGVAEVATRLHPAALLAALHQIEDSFGRTRVARNEARILDLDLITYNDLVRSETPILPHPRATQRAFVLYPLSDVAPDWQDPATGRGLAELIAALPPGQQCNLLGADGSADTAC